MIIVQIFVGLVNPTYFFNWVGQKSGFKKVLVLERDVYLTDDIIEVLKRHIKSLHKDTKLLFPS